MCKFTMLPVALLLLMPLGCTRDDDTGDTDTNVDTGATDPVDADGDGYSGDDDCNDADALAYTGAAEVCDGSDNDCDGTIDNDDAVDAATWYADTDADTFGDAAVTSTACAAPEGTVSNADDCNDADNTINPDGVEICGGIDEDCDALIDADDADLTDGHQRYEDLDLDGFGDALSSFVTCDANEGVEDSTDCDDTNVAVNPSASEVCNEVDDDCDGVLDPDDCECGGPAELGLNVTITDSTRDMDDVWEKVASDLGYTPTIVSVGTLDDANALDTTDILIISEGIDPIGAPELAAIDAWVNAGGSLYIQSEYQTTYATNQAFASIVNGMGASFSWVGTVSGSLDTDVVTSGCMASYPGEHLGFDYYWYGCEGTGIPGFLTYDSKDIAFQYCSSDPLKGQVITSTDQDYIHTADAQDELLIGNMLNALATHPASCP